VQGLSGDTVEGAAAVVERGECRVGGGGGGVVR